MGYNVTCDWCNGLVMQTNKPADIRAKLQEGDVVCDKCKAQTDALKNYYDTKKSRYEKQLQQVLDQAQKDLESFIKSGPKNKAVDIEKD